MATQVVTVTISALPTARTDGTAVAATDIGPANFYKNGALAGKSAAAAAVGTAFTDTVQAVDGDSWTVSINDTQTPSVEGVQSSAFVVSGVQAPPEAQLNAPSITGSVGPLAGS